MKPMKITAHQPEDVILELESTLGQLEQLVVALVREGRRTDTQYAVLRNFGRQLGNSVPGLAERVHHTLVTENMGTFLTPSDMQGQIQGPGDTKGGEQA